MDRRRGGRVDDDRRGMRGGRLDVRHRQERVGRRLEPDELHVCRRRPRLVELDAAEPPALELAEEDAGAVVATLGERDRVAGVQESTEGKLQRLEELRDEALHAGSDAAVQRRRDEGRLLARERAERLCDPGSFVELDRYVRHREVEFGMREKRPYGDAVVTGYGTIFG